jgi:hypothetical protein
MDIWDATFKEKGAVRISAACMPAARAYGAHTGRVDVLWSLPVRLMAELAAWAALIILIALAFVGVFYLLVRWWPT